MIRKIAALTILTSTFGCSQPLLISPPQNFEDFYPKPVCSPSYDATNAKRIKSLIPEHNLDNIVAEFTIYSSSDVFDGYGTPTIVSYNVRAYNSSSNHAQKITPSDPNQKEEFLREGKFNVVEIRENDQSNSKPLAYIYRAWTFTYVLFDLEKSDGPEFALCFNYWNPDLVFETARMVLEKRIFGTLIKDGLMPPFLLGPRKIEF